MKALKLIVLVVVLFLANPVQSQISISLNLGSPPQWGPVGYTHARYYYLPDVESYYDVQSSMFIYNSGGVWVHRTYLPTRYRDYDLYGGYKVVMTDYHGDRPYANYNQYKVKYAKGYRGQAQRSIGQRPARENNYNRPEQRSSSNRQVIQRDNDGRGNGRENGKENDKGKGNDKGNDKDKDKGHGNGKNK